MEAEKETAETKPTTVAETATEPSKAEAPAKSEGSEATAVTTEDVHVEAKTNMINLTVKTPKEKETVSIDADASVKEVCERVEFTCKIVTYFLSNFYLKSSKKKCLKNFQKQPNNCA